MKIPQSELDHLLAMLTPGEQADFQRLFRRLKNGNENDELLVMISCLLFIRGLFSKLPEQAVAERRTLTAAFATFSAQLDQRLIETTSHHQNSITAMKILRDTFDRYSASFDRSASQYSDALAFICSDDFANAIADKAIQRLQPTLEKSIHSISAELKEATKYLVKEHLDFIPKHFDEEIKRAAFLKNLDHLFAKAARPKAPMVVPWLLAVALAGAVGYMLH